MAALGESFMAPKPGQDTEHLWVIITAPNPQSGEVLMVNVTTLRPHTDTTTVLNPGDHPFVVRPSGIFYSDARFADKDQIDRGIAAGVARPHAKFDAAVLKRIQAGVLSSPFTPKKIKTAYAEAVADGRT